MQDKSTLTRSALAGRRAGDDAAAMPDLGAGGSFRVPAALALTEGARP